jgi:hypothetical protein
MAQLVQSLATMWFPHSTKHPYPIPQAEVVTKPTQVSLCLNPKLATQFEKYLLFALLNTIVITYIIPYLPRTPLMLWHIHWMNKCFMHLNFCNHWTKFSFPYFCDDLYFCARVMDYPHYSRSKMWPMIATKNQRRCCMVLMPPHH